jgi:hypothetical protein
MLIGALIGIIFPSMKQVWSGRVPVSCREGLMARRNLPTDVFKYIQLGEPHECWPWTAGANKDGIPYFSLNGRKIIAYRLVYKLVHPDWDIDNPREVLRHKCEDEQGRPIDNPLCCNPDHVIPGTHIQNMLDMVLRGRQGLTKEMVYAILSLVKEHPEMTHKQVADRISYKYQVNVSRQCVTDLLAGNRHRELRNLIDAEQRAIDESGMTDEQIN